MNANDRAYDAALSAKLARKCTGGGWRFEALDMPTDELMFHVLTEKDRDIQPALTNLLGRAAESPRPHRDWVLGAYRFPDGALTICLGRAS